MRYQSALKHPKPPKVFGSLWGSSYHYASFFMEVMVCMGFSVLGMKRLQKAATQTREVFRANATATHIAATTDRAGYKFVDHFIDNTCDCFTNTMDDDYLTGKLSIENGA